MGPAVLSAAGGDAFQQVRLGGEVGGDLGGAGAARPGAGQPRGPGDQVADLGGPDRLHGHCPSSCPSSCPGRPRPGRVADAVAAGGLVVLGGDDAQVVDPGGWRRPGGVLRLGLGVGMPADVLRPCQAPGLAVPADLDDGQVEGVEDALDAAPGQRRIGLIGPAEQLDRGGLGDEPPLSPQERLAQLGRRRGGERVAGQPPLDRRLPRLPVRPGMVGRLVPGGEQLVHLGQVRDGRAVADLDQELLPHDSEKSFRSFPGPEAAGRRCR